MGQAADAWRLTSSNVHRGARDRASFKKFFQKFFPKNFSRNNPAPPADLGRERANATRDFEKFFEKFFRKIFRKIIGAAPRQAARRSAAPRSGRSGPIGRKGRNGRKSAIGPKRPQSGREPSKRQLSWWKASGRDRRESAAAMACEFRARIALCEAAAAKHFAAVCTFCQNGASMSPNHFAYEICNSAIVAMLTIDLSSTYERVRAQTRNA